MGVLWCSHPTRDSYKMRPTLPSLPLLSLLVAPLLSSPLFLTPSFLRAGTATFLTLGSTTITVAEVAPLGLISLGAVVKGAAKAGLALRAAKGKREALVVKEEVTETNIGLLDTLETLEPEQCFRRTFCAVAAGEITIEPMVRLLDLLQDAREDKVDKLREAANYGLNRNIDSCEARYSCMFSVSNIEEMYVK